MTMQQQELAAARPSGIWPLWHRYAREAVRGEGECAIIAQLVIGGWLLLPERTFDLQTYVAVGLGENTLGWLLVLLGAYATWSLLHCPASDRGRKRRWFHRRAATLVSGLLLVWMGAQMTLSFPADIAGPLVLVQAFGCAVAYLMLERGPRGHRDLVLGGGGRWNISGS